jgi:lactoylglutathione lyase
MLKAIRNVDYTVIFCHEMEPMKHFYADVLGFPIAQDFGTWVVFQVGGVLLTLNTRGTGYEGVKEYHGAIEGDGACLQLAFRVAPSEVEDCYQELLQKDVTILQEPRTQETGHKTLFFKDPENNILEVYAEL